MFETLWSFFLQVNKKLYIMKQSNHKKLMIFSITFSLSNLLNKPCILSFMHHIFHITFFFSMFWHFFFTCWSAPLKYITNKNHFFFDKLEKIMLCYILQFTLRHSFRLRVDAWCKASLNQLRLVQLLWPKTKIMQTRLRINGVDSPI